MAESSSTLAVHRCRFVDFAPSAVTALCFPPLPLPSIKGKKAAKSQTFPGFGPLVVGRANGNIELCEWTGSGPRSQAPQAWVVRKVRTSARPSRVVGSRSVRRHSWGLTHQKLSPSRSPSARRAKRRKRRSPPGRTSDYSVRGVVANLSSGTSRGDASRYALIVSHCSAQRAYLLQRTVSSQGGPIWSISPNAASTILALGCEDGSVRLLSLLYDQLTHLRRLDRVKSRILSIAWGPPVPRTKNAQKADADSDSDDDEDEWSESWLVTGGSDSSIRKLDFATGRVLERMGTDKVRGERTLVWAVGVLG